MAVIDVSDLETYTDRWATWIDPGDTALTGICGDVVVDHPEQFALAVASASWFLWELSGRQYGVRRMTVRPCRYEERCSPREIATGFYPSAAALGIPVSGYLGTGDYSWGYRCGCGAGGARGGSQACSCERLERLTLPAHTLAVDEVHLDGNLLDPSAYALWKGRWLVRRDGDEWPRCQDVLAPLTEVGTLGVMIRQGRLIPPAGTLACAVLAKELASFVVDPDGCKLPERMTTATLGGMTVAMLDPMDFIDKRRMGLFAVDTFLGTVNPNGLRRRARVSGVEDL